MSDLKIHQLIAFQGQIMVWFSVTFEGSQRFIFTGMIISRRSDKVKRSKTTGDWDLTCQIFFLKNILSCKDIFSVIKIKWKQEGPFPAPAGHLGCITLAAPCRRSLIKHAWLALVCTVTHTSIYNTVHLKWKQWPPPTQPCLFQVALYSPNVAKLCITAVQFLRPLKIKKQSSDKTRPHWSYLWS